MEKTGCNFHCMVCRGWENWGCSAWGGEGSGVTLEQLSVPGAAARELERGWDKGRE